MDPSSVQATPSIEEDEWDTEGFVIPSLGIEDPDRNKTDFSKGEDSKLFVQARREENIYLGPHGAPPSQAKQQKQNTSIRKQRFKQKLKEADGRNSGTGRENKVDNLRELVGGGKMPVVASKSSPRGWLDPHCHESLFERRRLH
ncbi:hypothetical protein Pfo_013482 [Paulownia fortunei]|nr:hypothetical protein Pfo_013482 [Paulownia fortunei]